MILPRLRSNLDLMPSPVTDRPGLLIRDSLQYSDATLIVPPLLLSGLEYFDGKHTDLDLRDGIVRSFADREAGSLAGQMIKALSEAGFLEDEIYAGLKQKRHLAFARSPVRHAAFAGSAYPAELTSLREVMREYLAGATSAGQQLTAIAAPHVSPEGGWQSYRAAYTMLTPELRDRTFVILGTSHYGEPGKFGLTRKVFETPFGQTSIAEELVNELESQPAALVEDYCQAIEHSIEFQVIFLQTIYGPAVRILPILCGSFGRSFQQGAVPEDDPGVQSFLQALAQIAEREKDQLFWVLGVDMAHMGMRYGDNFTARAEEQEMTRVRERDQLRIERINAGDPHGFWRFVKGSRDDLKWCGSSPFYTFLKAVPQARGVLHRYEQWNIDERSVVSFAGMSFSR